MRSSTRFTTGWFAITLLAGFLLVGFSARADDCTFECVDAMWYQPWFTCLETSPMIDCEICDLTCPGGGGPDPLNPTP